MPSKPYNADSHSYQPLPQQQKSKFPLRFVLLFLTALVFLIVGVLGIGAHQNSENSSNQIEPVQINSPDQTTTTETTPEKSTICPLDYDYFQETGYCYKAHLVKLEFIAAKDTCLNEEADLASIHSTSENQFLLERFLNKTSKPDYNFWIGLDYSKEVWQWTDGTDLNQVNWVKPPWPRIENKMMAVVMTPEEGKWISVGSNFPMPFFCKKSTEHSKYPKRGCESGHHYFKKTEHCFEVIVYPESHEDAVSACERSDSQLPSIHSEDENQFLGRIYKEEMEKQGENDTAFWIGLKRVEEQFVWLDNSKLDYENFMEGKRDVDWKGHAAMMNLETLEWEDGDEEEIHGLICQSKSIVVSSSYYHKELSK